MADHETKRRGRPVSERTLSILAMHMQGHDSQQISVTLSLPEFFIRRKLERFEELATDPKGLRIKEIVQGAISRQNATGARSDLTVEYAREIFPKDDCCLRCHRPFDFSNNQAGHSASLDRVVPSFGYMKGNVWWVCDSCNNLKSSYGPMEMIHEGTALMEIMDQLPYLQTHRQRGTLVQGGIFLDVWRATAQPKEK